ncbi:hypothetical protein HXY32_05280 [Candidatus Bathyarchaeota archaeon]|nr:hypothetical protein [Candidatus Bathyarchaeota archaeon]
MKEKIAVATVSGKAYYLIVNELKRRNTPFLSLIPTEPIPVGVKVVITTKEEKHKVNHGNILVYQEGVEPEALVNEALRIIQGKEYYEKIAIGVDPGEVFGLAVLADGKVIETENCFSVEETLSKIESILRNLRTDPLTIISVKIGDGVPLFKEKLLRVLDGALPSNVMLESVSEAGTDRYLNEAEHRRGLRDIISAIRIAGRNGHKFLRSKTNESNH